MKKKRLTFVSLTFLLGCSVVQSQILPPSQSPSKELVNERGRIYTVLPSVVAEAIQTHYRNSGRSCNGAVNDVHGGMLTCYEDRRDSRHYPYHFELAREGTSSTRVVLRIKGHQTYEDDPRYYTSAFGRIERHLPPTVLFNDSDKEAKAAYTSSSNLRGSMGVEIVDVSSDVAIVSGLGERSGALVLKVATDLGAAKAGLVPGDIVLRYNGIRVTQATDLPPLVERSQPGSSAKVEIWRNRKKLEVAVVIFEKPEAMPNAPDLPQDNKTAGNAPAPHNESNLEKNILEFPRRLLGAMDTVNDVDAQKRMQSRAFKKPKLEVIKGIYAVHKDEGFSCEGDGFSMDLKCRGMKRSWVLAPEMSEAIVYRLVDRRSDETIVRAWITQQIRGLSTYSHHYDDLFARISAAVGASSRPLTNEELVLTPP